MSAEFLDSNQYTNISLKRYELIFGKGFISTGGLDSTTRLFDERLAGYLKPGMKVLDVGCGIGGGDALMADRFGVEVHGVDLSTNALKIAKERYSHRKDLRFDVLDAVTADLPAESYDLIYSRDTLLHINEKSKLFANLFRWLKPGGRVLITDYCAGPLENWSPEFTAYVKQRGYTLLGLREYGEMLTAAGFTNVDPADVTESGFVRALEEELERMKNPEFEETFRAEFGSDDAIEAMRSLWKRKIERAHQGMQLWGLLLAEKPKACE